MAESNRENIRAWVDALRSGRFKQGRDRLAARAHGKVRYCCLGVASVLACEAGIPLQLRWVPDHLNPGVEHVAVFEDGDGRKDRSYLPLLAQQWLGIEGDCPSALGRDLSLANDAGTPLAEIADLIEAEWLTDAPGEVTP